MGLGTISGKKLVLKLYFRLVLKLAFKPVLKGGLKLALKLVLNWLGWLLKPDFETGLGSYLGGLAGQS